MDQPLPPPDPTQPPLDDDARAARWAELLNEMNSLNAQLEYLRLLLRVGVRPL